MPIRDKFKKGIARTGRFVTDEPSGLDYVAANVPDMENRGMGILNNLFKGVAQAKLAQDRLRDEAENREILRREQARKERESESEAELRKAQGEYYKGGATLRTAQAADVPLDTEIARQRNEIAEMKTKGQLERWRDQARNDLGNLAVRWQNAATAQERNEIQREYNLKMAGIREAQNRIAQQRADTESRVGTAKVGLYGAISGKVGEQAEDIRQTRGARIGQMEAGTGLSQERAADLRETRPARMGKLEAGTNLLESQAFQNDIRSGLLQSGQLTPEQMTKVGEVLSRQRAAGNIDDDQFQRGMMEMMQTRSLPTEYLGELSSEEIATLRAAFPKRPVQPAVRPSRPRAAAPAGQKAKASDF